MTEAQFARPTTTQRIRTFLSSHGERLPVCSTVDEARDSLIELLHSRRNDTAFWDSLRILATTLHGDRARGHDGLIAPEAEVLSDRQIADLLGALQAALGAAKDSGRTASAFFRQTGAAGMACITMIATAFLMGCDRQPAETPVRISAEAGIANAPASAPIPEVDASVAAPDALDELFRDGSPDQIAAQLEAMIEAGLDSSVAKNPDASATSRKRPSKDNGSTISIPVPLYKGVTV